MPKAFDTWTVFPHRPIEKLAENLWRVEGDIPQGGGTRVMTLARLDDGRVIVHNAIALEEPLMQEIESFGKPAVIVVPNGFHRLDAKVYKARYPEAKVYCPEGARKKVAQVVSVDGNYDDAPHDEHVSFAHLEGTKKGEGVLVVRSNGGATVTLNDALCNLPPTGGFMGFLFGPTGHPSVARVARWLVMKEKASFKDHLTRLAATPALARLIVSHGRMVESGAADALRAAADEL
jgi:hypothetical protein